MKRIPKNIDPASIDAAEASANGVPKAGEAEATENIAPEEQLENVPPKKKKKALKAVCIIVGIILLLLIAAFVVYKIYTGKINHVELNLTDEELGITPRENLASEDAPEEEGEEGETEPETTANTDDITNFALFGVDPEDYNMAVDVLRSDLNIIVSINKTKGTIKCISVLRDSKVPIDGYYPQKINAAYHYGGAPLAIKTLNQNFHTDIRDYVTVDFYKMEDVIDLVDGVDVYLTAAEANHIGIGYEAGTYHLNGYYALQYCSIRSLDSDIQRASRQQNTLMAILEKARELPVTSYPEFVAQFLQTVETSLTYSELMSFIVAGAVDYEMTFYTVPDADYETDLWGGIDETGSWVWVYDLDAAADRIHSIIYE